MKRLIVVVFLMFLGFQPLMAQSGYHVEVLQLGDIEIYERAYDGLLDGLARQGLVKGYNLSVTRTVVDTSVPDSLWQRFLSYLSNRKICSRVIERNPDLVITIGTSATKRFQEEIVSAGIPLVYTSAIQSRAYLPKGTTGVSLSTTAADVVNASLLTLPDIRTIGVIHSPDTDAAAFVQDLKTCSQGLGLKTISKEIDMNDSILPAAEELIAQKIDAFVVPPDIYYEKRGWEASRELIALSQRHKLPCVSSLISTTDGPFLSLSPDFEEIGDLTASCVKDILINKVQPEEHPVIAQRNSNYVVDLKVSQRIGICFRPQNPDLLSLNR